MTRGYPDPPDMWSGLACKTALGVLADQGAGPAVSEMGVETNRSNQFL